MIDELEAHRFVGWFGGYAALATCHFPDPGQLQLVAVHPTIRNERKQKLLKSARFEIGDDHSMADWAIGGAKDGWNICIEPRTVQRNSPGRGETVSNLALVIDNDGEGCAPVPVSFSVETSPGHEHGWIMAALSPQEADAIGQRLRKAAGADADTGVPKQPYILPGVPNYPTIEKIQSGRRTTVSRTFVKSSGGPTYTFQQLDALLPPLPFTPPVVFSSPVIQRSAQEISDLMWAKAKKAYRDFTLPMKDRSATFSRACWIAYSAGLTPSEVEVFILSEASNGCASKWLERGGQHELRHQLENQWRAWSARQSAA